LEAARKGITLLQNKDNLLPLNKEQTSRIVVLGQLADKEVIGDHGSSQVHPKYVVTPLQGLANISPSTEVVFYGGQNLDHAKELAKDADAVVFVVGYNHDDEGEYVSADQNTSYTGAIGGDRVESLGLHEDEIQLINTVGPVNANSIVVLVGGNMIMMTEWKDRVSAVLMTYYAGMEGGTAIAEILFGDVNPSGKLPYVIPFKENDLPQVNWDTDSQWYDYYHGYAKLEKEGVKPLLPYGFGLSYTTFAVSGAAFTTDGLEIVASCMVKNTGNVKGTEVVQMYVGFKNSSIDRPVKLLRGFTRVALKPGESKHVTISCPVEKVKWYNPQTNSWELEHMNYEVYIGTSSDNKDLLAGSILL
jgi:beta-glucosidase